MAALRQEHRYGLSCGKINKNSPNQTLYHVKLTDTAIRTLEAYQNLKVRADSRYNFAAFFFFNVRVFDLFPQLYLFSLSPSSTPGTVQKPSPTNAHRPFPLAGTSREDIK